MVATVVSISRWTQTGLGTRTADQRPARERRLPEGWFGVIKGSPAFRGAASEVRSMSTHRTCLALSLLAVFGAGTFLPAAANAQANCQWYATTALKQQQENDKLKCEFKGDAWSMDIKAHTTWCASVAPDVWKAAAQKRDQDLQACAAKKK